MEKGTLHITRNKGKVHLMLDKENGKSQSISDGFFTKHAIWETFNESAIEVEYELYKGIPTILIVAGKTLNIAEKVSPLIRSDGRPAPRQQQRGTNYQPAQPQNLDGATAPYNFIPLSDTVIAVDKSAIPPHNVYQGNNGFIDLEIEAFSPLYVRRTLTEAEVQEQDRCQNANSEAQFVDFKNTLFSFYKPAGGAFRIPGSSLRGMLRTLYEIVTYSKMKFIDDHKLYYRSFADASLDIREEYSSQMLGGDAKAGFYPKVRAGYLCRDGRDYKINEAISYHRVEEAMVFDQSLISLKMSERDNSKLRKNVRYEKYIKNVSYKKVLFKAEKAQAHKEHTQTLFYSKVTDIHPFANDSKDFDDGYLVFSGWVPGGQMGKHMHWVIGAPTTHTYNVNESLISDYRKDSKRRKDCNRNAIDLLKSSDTEWGKPCFFIAEGNNIRAFGHTGIFRLAYDHKIGDLRPPSHRDQGLDMAEAVFGRVGGEDNTIAGRVFFEDATVTHDRELSEENYPKILSGPKPSSFQLYLSQELSDIKAAGFKGENRTGIKNYDSPNVRLSGYKLYWHRDHSAWVADPQDVKKNPKLYTMIKPLATGSKFQARIRFENLSDEELGALLFILNLPKGCCHKIGMAKPLGLGTILITPKLTLINRQTRYSSFCANGEQKTDILLPYLSAYSDLLKEKLQLSTLSDPWQIERLRELRRMLDFAHKPKNEKTRYMKIGHPNEYKDRKILKPPTRTT